ncbi:MaoC/PaaZ C-terminal domain-containing protein [Mycobacterium kiyosense]
MSSSITWGWEPGRYPPIPPSWPTPTRDGSACLPSYGVIPAVPMLPDLLAVPGIQVDLAELLHGEQDLEIHQTLPAEADVCTSATICDISDKGSGALVVLEAVTADAASGQPLVTNRFSAFMRGEGGFGRASSRPAPPPAATPAGAPDAEIACATLPQQALLYRLSGDLNPIHADPEFAGRGGFDRPILHGLCSYGIVCKAVVDEVLGGDVSRVASYRARFAGVVYPGETIVVRMWRLDDAVLIDAVCQQRGTAVLSNAVIGIR